MKGENPVIVINYFLLSFLKSIESFYFYTISLQKQKCNISFRRDDIILTNLVKICLQYFQILYKGW